MSGERNTQNCIKKKKKKKEEEKRKVFLTVAAIIPIQLLIDVSIGDEFLVLMYNNDNNNVQLSFTHQCPECSHHTY